MSCFKGFYLKKTYTKNSKMDKGWLNFLHVTSIFTQWKLRIIFRVLIFGKVILNLKIN